MRAKSFSNYKIRIIKHSLGFRKGRWFWSKQLISHSLPANFHHTCISTPSDNPGTFGCSDSLKTLSQSVMDFLFHCEIYSTSSNKNNQWRFRQLPFLMNVFHQLRHFYVIIYSHVWWVVGNGVLIFKHNVAETSPSGSSGRRCRKPFSIRRFVFYVLRMLIKVQATLTKFGVRPISWTKFVAIFFVKGQFFSVDSESSNASSHFKLDWLPPGCTLFNIRLSMTFFPADSYSSIHQAAACIFKDSKKNCC